MRRGLRTDDNEMYNTKTERWLRNEARKVSDENWHKQGPKWEILMKWVWKGSEGQIKGCHWRMSREGGNVGKA